MVHRAVTEKTGEKWKLINYNVIYAPRDLHMTKYNNYNVCHSFSLLLLSFPSHGGRLCHGRDSNPGASSPLCCSAYHCPAVFSPPLRTQPPAIQIQFIYKFPFLLN